MSQQQEDGEDGPDAQPIYPSRGPDREGMANDYLPGQDDWVAKSVLDLNDPQAVAALQHFDVMFPEVEDMQPMIDGVIDEFLKGQTSVEGAARKEYGDILRAMFGGTMDEQTQRWASLLGAGDEDD